MKSRKKKNPKKTKPKPKKKTTKKKQKKKKKQQFTNRSNKHIIVSRLFLRLSREKSVKSMCYLQIYTKVYLMHKTNHA